MKEEEDDCAPTVRGEIKKARASNYDFCSALNEFVDNSLDAGAETVQIVIREREDSGRWIHKILISDDAPKGIGRESLRRIFSWTFERNRDHAEIGEFGTGFKAAAVNLGNKLSLLTIDGRTHECTEAIADWSEMEHHQVWAPKILSIDHEYMKSYHPFLTGTTIVLEDLRQEFMPRVEGLKDRIVNELASSYKYYLKHHPLVRMIVQGDGGGSTVLTYSEPLESMRYYFDSPTKMIQSRILVYRDRHRAYRLFVDRDSPQTNGHGGFEVIEFIEKRKNGNSVVRAVREDPHGYTLMDTLVFRSCSYYDPDKKTVEEAGGTVDIVRNHRVLGRNVSYRMPRTDNLASHLKHELIYQNKWIHSLLGVRFNKSADSHLPEGEMRYTLEFIQRSHEKELLRHEKNVLGRVRDLKKEDDDFFCLEEKELLPPSPSPPPPPPPPNLLSLSSPLILCPISPPSLPSLPLLPSTPQLQPSIVENRRKNFSLETKLEVIKKQECRDTEFDFRLLDSILPVDYDHKNGHPANNSRDNCQALSVISHALKSRRPELLEEYKKDRAHYIVELLNCITSSKYFIEAFLSDRIDIRPKNDASILRDGLFVIVNKKKIKEEKKKEK